MYKYLLIFTFLTGLISCDSTSDESIENQICITPTALQASNITETSADLTWVEVLDASYEIEFGLQGFSLGTGTTITSPGAIFLLENLDSGTNYDFYVKAICNDDLISEFSPVHSFTTQEVLCETPLDITASLANDNNILVNWSSDTIVEIEYGIEGFSTGSGITTTQGATQSSFTIQALSANITYEIQLRSKCSETVFSDFSSRISVTTGCGGGGFLGDVFLGNQEQVEAFGAMCIRTISGNLSISGTVTDLSPLFSLEQITDNVSISGTTNLTTLQGLNNLRTLSDLSTRSFLINDNQRLESLEGLSSLSRVMGIEIARNPVLTSLNGLDSLQKVGIEGLTGALSIFNNNILPNLSGLESLEICGSLGIFNNPMLTSLDGLTNLSICQGSVRVKGNLSLTSLDGLENLTTISNVSGNIGRTLEIEDNDILPSLNGLESLLFVGDIEIGEFNGNDLLSDFCALKNLFENGSFGQVTIQNNAANPTPKEIVANCP